MPRFFPRVLATLGLTAVALTGVVAAPAQAATTTKPVVAGAKLTGGSASAMLEKIRVRGKAPKTGYDRTKWFGSAWGYDYDRNSCQTRQDILSRDMSKVRFKSGRCTVASGTLADPYTGKTKNWKVGANTVDIDHLVALGDVWVSGGQYWTGTKGQQRRKEIANDPLNLIAADASANRAKGDKNAAEWLPANKKFRCTYVATQISVKYKYALSVTSAEKAQMKRVLAGCKGQTAAKVTRLSITTGTSDAGTSANTSRPSAGVDGAFVSGTVHPGAFCSQKGARGKAKSGKTYTCKTNSTEARLRWRA